ncbi:MAG TPA: endonuclease/exonuclease/phosphatase family protein [Acidimicrobiia bacterium]|nr:endonuclease/exonuclease/phosphatase family protein [Acidimicrobiia bacterium]
MRLRHVLIAAVTFSTALPAGAVTVADGPAPAVPVVDGTPVCGTAGTGPHSTVPANSVVRAGTYNVLHSQGEQDAWNLTKRLPQILDAMEAADAHVWGLQEVTNNSQHGRIAELIAEGLAARTGRSWDWCWFLSNPHVPGEPDVNEGGGGPLSDQMAEFSNFPSEGDFREGVAVVTSLDITEARSRRLTPRAYEAPVCIPPDPLGCNLPAVFDSRQVMWTRIDTGDAGGLDFFNTHLAHGLTDLSGVTKRAQVEMALATIEQWASADPLPDLFVGDFNSTSEDDRYATVVDSGFVDTYLDAGALECDPSTHVGCTSDQQQITDTPEPTTTSRIDFVFARPGSCGLSSLDASIVGTNAVQQPDGRWLWPSDHLGVRTTLRCDAASR